MIRLWKLLHERKALETDAEKAIREKYEAFLTILTENEHSLDLMTELEKNLYENRLISIPYLKNMVKNLSKSIRSVVDNLEKLSGGRYGKLIDVYENIESEIRKILTGSQIPIYTPVIIPMDDIHRDYIDKVGSKMANLGELRKHYGIPVPDGFAITACAYTHFAEYNDLVEKIYRILAKVDITQSQQLLKAEKEIKDVILGAQIPPEIEHNVRSESEKLEKKHSKSIYWAVRSSAVGEDLENSFAGQFSSVLNVPTDQLLEKYKEVVASKYNARSMLYQRMKRIRVEDVNMSVGVMEMIRPLCSGVLYTTDPVKPHSREMVISAVWGLGQLLVEGVVSADMFVLKREPGFPLVKEEIAQKEVCLKWLAGGGVQHEMISAENCQKACLNETQLRNLAEMGLKIEAHFKSPQDIEWCFDPNGRLFVLQSRPLHVVDQVKRRKLSGPVRARVVAENAQAVAAGVGAGKVFKVSDIHELFNFPEGGVMVIKNSSPRFIGALHKAVAVVVEKGNRTDHMSSVVRELNVPCVVRIPSVFSTLQNGQEITVDATEGKIYEGRVTELLNAEDTVLKETAVEIKHTQSHRLLSRMADLVFPLNLTDPRLGDFSEDTCRTWHDILRFCHETALNEMFLLKEKGRVSAVKNVYRVMTDLPFSLFVFDLFGNTIREDHKKAIKPQSVASLPFQELWKGMESSDVSWEGPDQQMCIRDLFTAMSRTSTLGTESEDAKSYAVVTPEYLNLSLSMGYHYVVLDAFISDDPYNNYVSLSFKGGAAESRKRNLRALLIAAILKPLGFDVSVKNDFLKARIKAESSKELSKKINVIGRMMGVTRLLDMSLENEEMVNECVSKFYAHDDLLKGD